MSSPPLYIRVLGRTGNIYGKSCLECLMHPHVGVQLSQSYLSGWIRNYSLEHYSSFRQEMDLLVFCFVVNRPVEGSFFEHFYCFRSDRRGFRQSKYLITTNGVEILLEKLTDTQLVN